MKYLRTICIVLFCSVLLAACSKDEKDNTAEKKTVLLFYGAGYNNLSSDISGNISTILEGELPTKHESNKLLIFSHLSVSDNDCTTPVPSYLCEVYRSLGGQTVCDTLLTVDAEKTASDPEVMREVLGFVQSRYPEAHYGMIVSSHGTGWLPAGNFYGGFSTVIQYHKGLKADRNSAGRVGGNGRAGRMEQSAGSGGKELPLYLYNQDPDSPKTKTFGAEFTKIDGTKYSREMSVPSMAAAIPMHLDYLIFDACLMGGVEVAYQFRDKVDKIAFSPTEVLAAGFDYTGLKEQLLNGSSSPEAFCEAYFERYNKQTGSYHSATISVVKTSGLQVLAELCGSLIDRYRSAIAVLDEGDEVQQYFRYDYSWFYDLEDIFIKAGASSEDLAELRNALSNCISYKNATEGFLTGSGGFQIEHYSGLSMFLPSMSFDERATEYYKELDWNKAVNLVE